MPSEMRPAGVPADPVSGTAAVPLVPAIPAVDAQFTPHELMVPILTMLPIPFIRIEETTIDFNAKINSVQYQKTDSNFKLSAGLTAKGIGGYGPVMGTVKLKVSTSYQRNSRSGNSVNRTYSMAVHVRAVQDEMPPGMERLLGILEDSVQSKPQTV